MERQEPNQEPLTPWEVAEANLKRVEAAWGNPSPLVRAVKALALEENSPPAPELTDEEWLAQQKEHLEQVNQIFREGGHILVPKPRNLEDRKFWQAIKESRERAQKLPPEG